jgi:putative nucleotidyltransferase with HDIG domain
VDEAAVEVLERLWEHGHAGFLVGGGVRDSLLGRPTHDWDVATDARPKRLLEVFPDARYENRFGTVLVDAVQVTTFRRDHRYADHRRPESVTFTDSIDEDLARRDFTVNAIAWGRQAGAEREGFEDPTGGRDDLGAGMLRAVGDPDRRFDEDALRLLRAARIAAQVGLEVETRTLVAMRAHAADAGFLSSERIGGEVRRMLDVPTPSEAFGTLDRTGILDVILPELAEQRGVPQAKIAGHDLLAHSLATLDAAAELAPVGHALRMAALLHDLGKPSTSADGHFIGHAPVGAELARRVLLRLHHPSRESDRIARLIAEHMFQYQSAWSDAAVRRFIRRVGRDLVLDQLRLRQADNVGSGLEPDAGNLSELRGRVEHELDAQHPLGLADLAIDGNDLLTELGGRPGPWVGGVLERLLESVVADPGRNTRDRLLADAHRCAADEARSPNGRLAG